MAEIVCSSVRLGLQVLKGAMAHGVFVTLHCADCLLR